jgi:hypothetical protein
MCLTDFRDWKYIHSWLVFLTQLGNCYPHERRNYTTPPLPLPKVNVQYIQTVCGWGGPGWVVFNCVLDHNLQEFNTLFLTRFRTYKITTPPETKITSKDDI